MQIGGTYSISDWYRPFTDLELEGIEAIEAAFRCTATVATITTSTATSSSSSPIKRSRNDDSDGDRPTVRRRLPESIAGEDSFSLVHRPRNRFSNAYHYSSAAKVMMRYPTMAFKGHVFYNRTITEVEKSAKELLKIVEARKVAEEVILGFDIEWRPTFRRGVQPRKVAVMQICGDPSYCYVMHIIHSGIPQSLRSLLEDPTFVKVGVGIVNDATKVCADYNITVKGLEDLSALANKKLGGVPKKWSMASLTEMLICRQLPKPGKIRLGNWEADALSKEQLQYAATDAFVSWYLYQSLKTLTDAADKRIEELGILPKQ